jgi:hypothetical protein
LKYQLTGPRIWKIKAEGRNLWQAYDDHACHADPRIRQARQDFEDDKAARNIVQIEVRKVEESRGNLDRFAYPG